MGRVLKKRVVDKNEEGSDDENMEEARLDMPLPEGVLKVNLGIPIVIVC